ncbi:MAG: IS30 family transposase [Spirochaetales bacterium]|nr:IS30 family transposase [Spirochaetales bacterium]
MQCPFPTKKNGYCNENLCTALPGRTYFISSQRARRVSFSQIARDLGRSASTITREDNCILRPTGYYAAFVAHSYATARRRSSRRGSNFPDHFWKRIRELIDEDFSPEQIFSQLQIEHIGVISIQSIYRFIKKDRSRGGALFKHMRIISKVRRKLYQSVDSRGVLRGKGHISTRPDYINDRSELGHWEVDTVMGKDRNQCILTLVERKSGANRLAKLNNRTTSNVNADLIQIVSKEPHLFKTITFDNGTEFHGYKKIEEATGIICYFANPHHPWERGSNENFNGSLRQYIPKGRSLSYIGSVKIFAISNKLNSKPRKRLGDPVKYFV